MTHGPHTSGARNDGSPHIATIVHAGHLWDAYVDFENDARDPAACRARLRFEPPPGDEGLVSARTTVIIIEDSWEDALAKARSFDDRQLQGLLRSALPGDEEA